MLPWDTLYSAELRSVGQFEGICVHVAENWGAWKEWMEQEDPYGSQMPGEYHEKLAPFDKLILVKVLRPELVQ